MDLLCFCSVVCLLCLCARLFIGALWSPAGKGLTTWLLFVVYTVSLSLSHGILGQVWYLIVSFPDLCTLTYFVLSIFEWPLKIGFTVISGFIYKTENENTKQLYSRIV